MNSLVFALLLLLAPQKIGDVESSFDKQANFGALKTYAWAKGHEALTPSVHKSIVTAIDAQMASLGFTKAEAGAADTILKYHVVRGTDVDLKAMPWLRLLVARPEVRVAPVPLIRRQAIHAVLGQNAVPGRAGDREVMKPHRLRTLWDSR